MDRRALRALALVAALFVAALGAVDLGVALAEPGHVHPPVHPVVHHTPHDAPNGHDHGAGLDAEHEDVHRCPACVWHLKNVARADGGATVGVVTPGADILSGDPAGPAISTPATAHRPRGPPA